MLEVRGDAAFLHGDIGRDALLVGLGFITAAPLVLFGVAATRIPLTVLGLLQYITPTLQLLCGVVLLHEPLPPERLAGFVLVWIALAFLGSDALRAYRNHQDVRSPTSPPSRRPDRGTGGRGRARARAA